MNIPGINVSFHWNFFPWSEAGANERRQTVKSAASAGGSPAPPKRSAEGRFNPHMKS